MLLSHTEICELIERGVIENTSYDNVNSSSLDIRLGENIKIETRTSTLGEVVSLRDRDNLNFIDFKLKPDDYFLLYPENFMLAHSIEKFNLPNNISAEYKLKSSMARIGLEHLNAGWCDAGWNNSVLTLELKNMSRYTTIKLHHKDKIGQIVFFKHTPVHSDKSYAKRGTYNNCNSVSGVVKL